MVAVEHWEHHGGGLPWGSKLCWAPDTAWEMFAASLGPALPFVPHAKPVEFPRSLPLLSEPFSAALGSWFFHERWKTLAVDDWERQRWKKTLPLGRLAGAEPQPLPILPDPKCSRDVDVGPRARSASETRALRVLMLG